MPWRRAWQPIPIFLPGESHGQMSLVGYSPWGHRDVTEAAAAWKYSEAWVKHCIYGLLLLFNHSHVWLFETPWTAAHQASLSFTIFQSLLKLRPIESVMPSNYHVLCHPLLLLPSIFPRIRVFSNELALHIRWPKYWSFSIHSSNEYPGLIFFQIDWFDLLAIQGILTSLLQHHSSKASIL